MCCNPGNLVGQLLIIGERFSLWALCTCLICCLVSTIITMLCMAIGLGYNYCFVDMNTRYKYIPAHYNYPGSPYGQMIPPPHIIQPTPAPTIPPINPPSLLRRGLVARDISAYPDISPSPDMSITPDMSPLPDISTSSRSPLIEKLLERFHFLS